MSGNGNDLHDAPEALRHRALELAEAISTVEFGAEEFAVAADLARRLRECLHGPHRRCGYESGRGVTERGPHEWHGYLDHSPVRGVFNPIAPPLELESTARGDGTHMIVGRARLGAACEGPPHGVHGGWIAALFDEVLGGTQRLEGSVGATAILTVKYCAITPIDEDL